MARSSRPTLVTYSYLVTNTGPLDLTGIVVTDYNGTPGVPGDDFAAACPATTLAAGASMTCTSSVNVSVNTTNVAVVHGVTAGGNSANGQDDAVVQVLRHEPTPPPTDTLAPTAPSSPGSNMALILAALGILILGLSFVTPVPAVARRRGRR